MVFSHKTRDPVNETQAQIARLREQVEALMKDRVTPAVADFSDRAETAVRSASAAVRGQADALSGRVQHQPLIAISIAAAVGWVMGRVMR